MIVAILQQVPSYVMLGIPKLVEEPKVAPTPHYPLSPMGEACSRMDLTAIHQILFTTHYRDDEGSNEVNERKSVHSFSDYSVSWDL
jgi:BR-signaling kinase